MAIQLRTPARCDAPALSDLVIRNRDHFRSGEPLRPADYYSVENQERVIGKALRAGEAGSEYMFLIEEKGILVGRGIATCALHSLIDFAFTNLCLHRLQGETLIENRASQKVLERCGFSRYGTAPNYLRINGHWQDHHLYQLINDSWTG